MGKTKDAWDEYHRKMQESFKTGVAFTAQKPPQFIEIPSGDGEIWELPYYGHEDFGLVVGRWNNSKMVKEGRAPEIRPGGAGLGLRATLSGATPEQRKATLESKYKWSENMLGTDLYLDPDSGVIHTLDIKGDAELGDVVDLARPAANVIGEGGALFAASKVPGLGALQRAVTVGGAGTIADQLYSLFAKKFGGLQDPRGGGEIAVDAAKDLALRTAGEGLFGTTAGKAARAGAKKVGRGFGPREPMDDSYATFVQAYGEPPPYLGMITKRNSRINTKGQNLINYFPHDGGDRVMDAVEGTEAMIKRRIDEASENIAPADIGLPATPEAVGTRARQAIMGEKVPYDRLRARVGGWYETSTANVRAQKENLEEVLPLDTRIYGSRPQVTPLAPPGTPGSAVGGGQTAASAVMPGAPAMKRSGSPLLPGPTPGQASSAVTPVLPPMTATDSALKKTYDEMLANGVSPSDAAMTRAKTIIDNPDATLTHVTAFMHDIGKKGIGIPGTSPSTGTSFYAAARETADNVAAGVPEAAARLESYNRIAETHYDMMQRRMNKIFMTAGVDADPTKVFGKFRSAMTGDGNPLMLTELLTRMEPDDADFIRRGLLENFFQGPPRSTLKKWQKMNPEVKDIIAPPGTYWRQSYDDIADSEEALRLLEITQGNASTLSKEQRSLWNSWKSGAKTGGVLGGGISLFQGGLTPEAMLTAAASGVALGSAALVAEVGHRWVKRRGAKALTSPAYIRWVTTVTNAMPNSLVKRDQALDFIAASVPRIGVEAELMSLQEMEDMQELQEVYLDMLEEGPEAAASPGGILGPGARPPAKAGGIMSGNFGPSTWTGRR